MATWTFGSYTLALANTYFETHTEEHLWLSFSENFRSKAVSMAERQIWAYLGGWVDLTHPDDIQSKYRIRQDFAIYEQALYILQNSGAVPNGEETTPKWMANNAELEAEKYQEQNYYPVRISPVSKFWLAKNIRNPVIGRG